MKAMVHTKYGPPEVLQLTQCEKPVPKDNEIPIRVRTSTVTAMDYRMRGFKVSLPFWGCKPKPPKIPTAASSQK